MYGSATPPTIGDGKDPRFASELQRIFVAGGAINKPHGLHINEVTYELILDLSPLFLVCSIPHLTIESLVS